METGSSNRSRASHRRGSSRRYRQRRRDHSMDQNDDVDNDHRKAGTVVGDGDHDEHGQDGWDRMASRRSGRVGSHRNQTKTNNDDNKNMKDNVDNTQNSSSDTEDDNDKNSNNNNRRSRKQRRRRRRSRHSDTESRNRTRRSESPSTYRYSYRNEDADDHPSQRNNSRRHSRRDRDQSSRTRRTRTRTRTPAKSRSRRGRDRSHSSPPSIPSPYHHHHRSRSSRYEDVSSPVDTMQSSRRPGRSPRYGGNDNDTAGVSRYARRQYSDNEYNSIRGRDYRRRPPSPERSEDDSSRRHRRRHHHHLLRSPSRSRSRNFRENRPRKNHFRHHFRRFDSSSSSSEDDVFSSSSSSESSPDNAAAALPIRAGVVSDDEHQHHQQLHHQQHHQYPQYEEAAAQQNATTHPPPPSSDTKPKDKTGSDASSSRDDTVGHYRGVIGSVIANRYRITADVGLGTFGRVVECLDLKKRRSQDQRRRRSAGESSLQPVAIKVVRNVKRYYDSALIEADILEDVNRRGGRGISHCVMLFDAFAFGGHFCLVFESLGPSLYDFLKRHNYQPFPMICVRRIARQLLEALEFLHSFGLIHTDLKPENILLTSYREQTYKWHGRTYQIPESTHIKVIDFGGATYNDERKSSVVNTRQYRAPEVILGVGWSTPSDLWSAGCILAELCRGELLFATHDNLEHLALMERCIGPFSRRMLKRAKQGQQQTEFSTLANQAFDSSGRHRMERVLSTESYAYVQRMLPLDAMMREQEQQQPDGRVFLDLLRRMLVIDPDERKPASELLREHRL